MNIENLEKFVNDDMRNNGEYKIIKLKRNLFMRF